MFKSIFERLFWTNTVILLIVAISIGTILIAFVNSNVMDSQYNEIIKISHDLEYRSAMMQEEGVTDPRARSAFKQSLQMWADYAHADIIIANIDGDITESTITIDSLPQEYLDTIKNGEVFKERDDFGGYYDANVYVIGIPISYNGEIVGGMFFNTPLPQMRQVVTEMFLIFLFAASFAIAVAFIFVYRQSKTISQPISQINSAVRDIAAGDFTKRVTVNSADEIGQLASSFNFMADSIEKLENNRNEFISNVSHELRTPMTSISGFIQGILDHTIPPEKEADYLTIVLDETHRLTRMVNDLLEMSKMSSSEYRLDITDFDLNELVRLCIIQLESRISEKDLDLDVDFSQESLNVLADQDSIRRVLINLMDNAIKFSYPKTVISIKTWVEAKKAYFSIGNFGDGIDSADLSNVFERFYKTDKSRTRDKTGAGLGLSMVKNILVLHKQSIWVESDYAKDGTNIKFTKFTFTLERQ